MKVDYKRLLHTYVTLFIGLILILAVIIVVTFQVITIKKPNGDIELSNWPRIFTQEFSKEITCNKDKYFITEEGKDKLRENKLWLQIIDKDGNEIESYNKPENVKQRYSQVDLLKQQESNEVFSSTVTINGKDFVYLIGFHNKISKVTMYLDNNEFISGKSFIIPILGAIIFIVVVFGGVYGIRLTKEMSKIIMSLERISLRNYEPKENKGEFGIIYDNLNRLDNELKLREQKRYMDDKLRKEWISNITHDLKTPLSPIKGYAELIADPIGDNNLEKTQVYGKIILKNIRYAEKLIDDLKLTYQLENGMLPLNKKRGNIVRFIKEIVIDILNNPEFQWKNINFHSDEEVVNLEYDWLLLKRALMNLIYNSIIHNDDGTEIKILIEKCENTRICICDNGRGMSEEEVENLFLRYYRGTNTDNKTEGTGLGMAIAKEIIQGHNWNIYVESKLGEGTKFIIEF
ncbi:Signal transduction histidine kinase [Clostridium cavendishii DSM 21758]|uniref:histidine kinase n=1 Tax=Clostridium cavendishii DSM 21758 TaxID=1121302 RepID=A0A1M6MK63_9CLOT|nr:HAMP domain-containing sensor histidine kinase [Clostridium cavendishii]SHJ83858.1 Signal transduction histidine kinase [Clostridium cavendishii DSM 21758]